MTILSKAGHSVSYDKIQHVDTAPAEDIIQNYEDGQVIIPSNTINSLWNKSYIWTPVGTL